MAWSTLTAEISIGVQGHLQHELLGSVVVRLLHGKAKFPKCLPCMAEFEIRDLAMKFCANESILNRFEGSLRNSRTMETVAVYNMYRVFILKFRSVPESRKTIKMVRTWPGPRETISKFNHSPETSVLYVGTNTYPDIRIQLYKYPDRSKFKFIYSLHNFRS